MELSALLECKASETPLELWFSAVYHCSCNALEQFIMQGRMLNVNAQRHLQVEILPGCTALHMLAYWFSSTKYTQHPGDAANKVQLLLRHRADPQILNANGSTALDIANNDWNFKDPKVSRLLKMAMWCRFPEKDSH